MSLFCSAVIGLNVVNVNFEDHLRQSMNYGELILEKIHPKLMFTIHGNFIFHSFLKILPNYGERQNILMICHFYWFISSNNDKWTHIELSKIIIKWYFVFLTHQKNNFWKSMFPPYKFHAINQWNTFTQWVCVLIKY